MARNVRQLRNVVRTMLALRSTDHLTLADFNDSWLAGATRAEEPTVQSASRRSSRRERAEQVPECDALRRTLEAFHWKHQCRSSRLHSVGARCTERCTGMAGTARRRVRGGRGP